MGRIIFTLIVAILTHPLAAPVSAAADRFILPYRVTEAVFDPVIPRVYIAGAGQNYVDAIDLETRETVKRFTFTNQPVSLAITPDGKRLYAGLIKPDAPADALKRGAVGVINLETLEVAREFEVRPLPWRIAATDAEKVVLSGEINGRPMAISYDGLTGQERSGATAVRSELSLSVHPSQTNIYAAEVGFTPYEFYHFGLGPTGELRNQWTAPLGQDRYGNEIFVLPDGTRLLTGNGILLTTTTNQSTDLKLAGALETTGIRSVAFQTNGNLLAAVDYNSVLLYNYVSNQVVDRRASADGQFVGFHGDTVAVITLYGPPPSEIVFHRPRAQTAEENRAPTAVVSWSESYVPILGSTINLRVEGRDEDGDIQSIRVFNRGAQILNSTNSLFYGDVVVNSGTNEFYAIAYDNFGATATSAVVRVKGNAAPQIQLLNSSATYSELGSIVLNAQANDLDGSVKSVQFWLGSQLVATDTEAPYEYLFIPPDTGTYKFTAVVEDDLGARGNSQEVTITFLGPPDNLTANIPVETRTNVTLKGSTFTATRQKGEPAHAGVAGGKSIWFAWRSPSSGYAVIDTFGSDFDTVLGVYTLVTNAPLAMSNLIEGASNDDDPSSPPTSRVKFFAKNQVYYIAVDGHEGVAGNVVLRLNFAAASSFSNDLLATAAVANLNVNVMGSNVGASKEPGEPMHAGNTGGASVWWRCTLSPDYMVQITTTNSTFDTLLAVYTTNTYIWQSRAPTFSELTVVAENDDAVPRVRTSTVRFVPPKYGTYWIAVDGYNGGEGAVRLNITSLQFPALQNNAFVSAITLTGSSVLTNGHNVGATAEPGEPQHAGKAGTNSVWYRWTAPTNGLVSVSTRTSDFDTLLAVYTGDALTNLTMVAANDDDPASPPTSAVLFHATAGTEYRIAVAGYQNARGEFVLALNQTPTFQPRLMTQWLDGRLWLEVEQASGSAVLESSSDLINWQIVSVINPGDPPLTVVPDSSSAMRFYRAREEAE